MNLKFLKDFMIDLQIIDLKLLWFLQITASEIKAQH